MAKKPFTPSRSDGRSDRQIVFDLVQMAEPDTLFTFEQIIAALSAGVDKPVTRHRACAASRLANQTLQHEEQRALQVVKGMGYRVVAANEHLGLALTRKDFATRQFSRGVVLLKSCRLDELTDIQRRLHEGTTLVMGAYLGALRHLNARQNRQESALQSLALRIEKVEQSHPHRD